MSRTASTASCVPISEIEGLHQRYGHMLLIHTKATFSQEGWFVPAMHHTLKDPRAAKKVLGNHIIESYKWVEVPMG